MALNIGEICKGFRAAMTSATALMAKITYVYREEATGATYPYIVYDVLPGYYEPTFSEEVEGPLMQVNIWAKDGTTKAITAIDEIIPLVDAALSRATLTITDYEAISCFRIGGAITLPVDEDSESIGVHGKALQYRVEVSKSK